MGEGRPLDGYIRVSRVAGREGESYLSPSIQQSRIEQWATYKGITIAEWHRDEDLSGGHHTRPGLERAIKRALEGETGGIVSASIDRFSRTTELGLRDLRRLEAANARLAFVVEDIDTGTVYGRMIYTILLAVAEAFLANIKASWEITKSRAVERGAYISRTPFGYRRNPDSTLSPHPLYGPIVQEAFRLAASRTLQTAMSYLESKVPERTWTLTTTRRLISGRSYLGETRNGNHVQPGTHEPLVSRAMWEAAQSAPSRRQAKTSYPLSGIVQCENCRSAMIGGRGGTGQRTYRCSKRCDRPPVITAELLEEHVRAEAVRMIEGLTVSIEEPSDTSTLLERAVSEAEAELDAFAGDLNLRRALGSRYHDHLQTRVDAVETARAAYRESARSAQEAVVLSAPDVLENPQLLSVALRSMFDAILIRSGRGPVSRRVVLVPLDRDALPRMLGPEGSE